MAETKILVVEDEAIVAADLQTRLTRMGYVVGPLLDSGEKAVQEAELFKPNLVLMDIRLRGRMDGIEAAARIWSRFRVPVIFITAYEDEKSLQRAKEVEPYGYLLKPIKDRDLYAAIEVAVFKAGMEERLREAEERFRTLADFAYDWETWRGPDGKYVYISPSCERITGYAPEEFAADPYLLERIVYPEDRETIRDHIRRPQESSQASLEFRLVNRKGEVRWIHQHSRSVYNERGEWLGRRSSNRDVTERKEMEVALRQAHEEMERRVEERTAELKRANEQLKREIEERRYAENVLQERNELLESLFANIHFLVAYLDTQFNFIRVNRAYAEAEGRDPDEYVGKNHFDLFPNAENESIFRKVVETGKPYVAFARPFVYAQHPEKGVTYWDWTLHPVKGAAGDTEGLALCLVNVTERILAEQALKESEARLRSIFESAAGIALVLSEPADNEARIVEFSPGAERIFGYKRSEVLGKPLSILHLPEDRERFSLILGVLEHHNEGVHCEAALVKKTGEIFPAMYSAHAIRDAGTMVAGCLVVALDITERKTFERALRDSEERYRSLVESSWDAIASFDRDRTIVSCNRAFLKLFGYAQEEVLGRSVRLIHPSDESFRVFGEIVYPLILRNGFHRAEWNHMHRDGTVFPVETTISAMKRPDGRVHGYVAVIRDMTRRKHAEEALRKSEQELRALSSQLLTAQENERKRIARELHDSISQSLTAIKIIAENTMDLVPPETSAYRSLEGLTRMAFHVIEEIRTIISGLRPAILDNLGALATLSCLCREFEQMHPSIRIETRMNLEEDRIPEPLKVVLYRVVQEALNNIAKHSGASHAAVLLTVREERIHLRIQDDGSGFDLHQVSMSRVDAGGVGLTSMRERVELSGGRFLVVSEKGGGAVIEATWPEDLAR